MPAQEEQFEAMIQAMRTLKTEILEACDTMKVCSGVCASQMDEDDLSTGAKDRVDDLEVNLRNITSNITDLQKELGAKRDQLIELKRRAQESGQW